jgi:hypothetical protein
MMTISVICRLSAARSRQKYPQEKNSVLDSFWGRKSGVMIRGVALEKMVLIPPKV